MSVSSLPTLSLSRPRVVAEVPITRSLRAGAARVDLTPGLGRVLLGHGPTACESRGAYGRLFANVLVLDDGFGERVALVQCDLHGGSRWVTERVAQLVAPTTGITTERLWLAASHTHRGPGAIYANHTYDRIAGTAFLEHWEGHFDQGTAEALAGQIAAGVMQAVDELAPARVGTAAVPVPRVSWNRSGRGLDGLQLGDDVDPDEQYLHRRPPPLKRGHASHLAKRFNHRLRGVATTARHHARSLVRRALPDLPPPVHTLEQLLRRTLEGDWWATTTTVLRHMLHPRRRWPWRRDWDHTMVDENLYAIAAFGEDEQPIGAFCVYGATPSLIGGPHAIYTGDVFQEAAQWVGQQRARRGQTPIPVGIAGGSLGDVNAYPVGVPLSQVRAATKQLDKVLPWVREIGAALGAGIEGALAQASSVAHSDVRLSVRYVERVPSGARFVPRRLGTEKVLGRVAHLGASTLRGSELGWSPLGAVIREGLLAFRRHAADPHYPKVKLPALEAPPEVYPFRLLRLCRSSGDPVMALGGVPGELSTALATQIQESVATILGCCGQNVVLTGPCGEFGGYFGTVWEYLAQPYEASSTLWGRWTGEWARFQMEELAEGISHRAGPQATFHAAAMPTPRLVKSRRAVRRDPAASPNPRYRPPRLACTSLKSLLRHASARRFGFAGPLEGGLDLVAKWRGPSPNGDEMLWEHPLVTLCRAQGGAWAEARLGDVVIDDVVTNAMVWCEVKERHAVWLLRWTLPDLGEELASLDIRELALRVDPRFIEGPDLLTADERGPGWTWLGGRLTSG